MTAVSVAPGRVCPGRRPCRPARAVLRFELSAGAELVARLQRRRRPPRTATRRSRGWSSVRSFSFQGHVGLNRRALPVAGLRRGGYRVLVRAYDRDSTRTHQALAHFCLRRPDAPRGPLLPPEAQRSFEFRRRADDRTRRDRPDVTRRGQYVGVWQPGVAVLEEWPALADRSTVDPAVSRQSTATWSCRPSSPGSSGSRRG